MGGPTCHHVEKALSTYINAHGRPSLTPCRKGSVLTSTTMGGPSCHRVGKALNTYINAHGRPSVPPCRKGSTLKSTTMGGLACHHVGKAQHLHQRPWEAQPATMSERLSTYINDHGRPNLPPCRKGSHHLHQRTWEAQPATMSKRLSCVSASFGLITSP